MKLIKLLGFLLFFLILLTACAPAPAASFMSNAAQVQSGQTKNDVVAVMGQPQQSQSNGSLTAWQYCVKDDWSSVGTYYVIAFSEDIVYYTSSYSKGIVSTCEAHFEPTRWQDEADVSIEVR